MHSTTSSAIRSPSAGNVQRNRCLAGRLRELIAALDRRVPQLARMSETSIARDAAALKRHALQRIAELEDESV